MIRTKNALSDERYLITPSLLNSWLWIYESANNVREKDSDVMSIDDRKAIAQERAKEQFLAYLERIPGEPNKYMQLGIDFEDECYQGKTCISPIIEGGSYQVVGTKYVNVENINFLMYGRLDVLKGGVIYDIKKVGCYKLNKYKWSCQHRFYLDLFERAKYFEYLIYDGKTLHREKYYRENCTSTEEIIKNFVDYLIDNDLLDIYKEKWKARR